MATDRSVPTLLCGLTDDAAGSRPGSRALSDAVAGHRTHRAAWYAPLVGPLLVRAADATAIARLLVADERMEVGLVGAVSRRHLAALSDGVVVRKIESAVAMRGEDPLPGLRAFIDMVDAIGGRQVGGRQVGGRQVGGEEVTGYAEIPLTAGLMAALDVVAQAREQGVAVVAKFRIGGLAAELFPTPAELAGVICACRDRRLPFTLTGGLRHAVRHLDPDTGFTHHGFVNVLVATADAAAGARRREVTVTLANADSLVLAEAARCRLGQERPLWIGFGARSIAEPVAELRALGLLGAAGR